MIWGKISGDFFIVSTASLHQKWNRIRLFSPKVAERLTIFEEYGKLENFKKISEMNVIKGK